VVRDVEQHIVNHQVRPRPGVPPIGSRQRFHHSGEELLIAGTIASVIAAATADVDVLPAILPWHHTLEQGLQQDRCPPCLELGISLIQEAPLFLDVLAVNRIAIDDQRVDPQRDVLDEVLPAFPEIFLPSSGSTPRQ
jgi:hypothetical protein